jgi:hypothetical protein
VPWGNSEEEAFIALITGGDPESLWSENVWRVKKENVELKDCRNTHHIFLPENKIHL